MKRKAIPFLRMHAVMGPKARGVTRLMAHAVMCPKTLALILLPALLVSLFAWTALAAGEQAVQVGETGGSVFVPYRADEPDGAGYTWKWTLPRLDESEPNAYRVNSYYDYFISDQMENFVPLIAESMAEAGVPVLRETTFQTTCSNGSFISFLITTRLTDGEEIDEVFEGHTFSLTDGMPGSTLSLPQLLGALEIQAGNQDTWLENRQTEKANRIIRSLVWDRISASSVPVYPDFTEETLAACFFPELDFYLNEQGNPVFFLQPGDAAPSSSGRLDFPLSLEEIEDEW